MKILGIEHLGIAVNSIEESAPFWKHVLKLESTEKDLKDLINKKLIFGINKIL